MNDIYVIGVGMTPFGRHLDLDMKALTRQAVEAALADAAMQKEQLEAAFFGNTSQGHMEGQHMIRGQIALRAMGIGRVPVVNIENACASGSSAFAPERATSLSRLEPRRCSLPTRRGCSPCLTVLGISPVHKRFEIP
jgi:hypothetical protein